MSGDSNLKFDDPQHARLIKLGLSKDQIAKLRRILPEVQWTLTNDPTIQDVREKFVALDAAMRDARNKLASLLRAGPNTPDWQEVFHRIQRADFEGTLNSQGESLGGDGEAVDRAHRALLPFSKIVEHARQAFEAETATTEQRRPNEASFVGVQLIDETLRQIVLDQLDPAKREIELSRYEFHPSISSKFFDVVEICYEAIGRSNRSLDGPIRKYIAWRRESR